VMGTARWAFLRSSMFRRGVSSCLLSFRRTISVSLSSEFSPLTKSPHRVSPPFFLFSDFSFHPLPTLGRGTRWNNLRTPPTSLLTPVFPVGKKLHPVKGFCLASGFGFFEGCPIGRIPYCLFRGGFFPLLTKPAPLPTQGVFGLSFPPPASPQFWMPLLERNIRRYFPGAPEFPISFFPFLRHSFSPLLYQPSFSVAPPRRFFPPFVTPLRVQVVFSESELPHRTPTQSAPPPKHTFVRARRFRNTSAHHKVTNEITPPILVFLFFRPRSGVR